MSGAEDTYGDDYLILQHSTPPPLPPQQQDPYSAISCENCRQCIRLPPLGSPTKKNKQQAEKQVPNTMYTNAANLQRTIWLQQVRSITKNI